MLKKINWASLEALFQRAVSQKESDTAIVLFHGFGAPMEDLVPLSSALPTGKDYDWFFPGGPHFLPFPPARAWFPLDTVQLENSLQKGPLDSLSTVGRLEDLMEGLNFVFPFVDKVCQKYSQVILGGFSQGALMALELTLGGHFDLKINKLILFSAVLTEEDSWKKKLQSSPHLPSDFAIFQGHGREDPLLSLYSAQKLRDILLAGPLPLDYHEFTGGHEIPPSLLEQCDRFLNNSRSVGTKK